MRAHEDVGVVAARDRGERAGLARCRPRSRWSRSKPKPTTVWPAKSLGQAPERARRSCRSTATVWPDLLERAGELAAHPAAADDDDVHRGLPRPANRAAGCYATSLTRSRCSNRGGSGRRAPCGWHAVARTGRSATGLGGCSTWHSSSGCSSVARWRRPRGAPADPEDDRARGLLVRRDLVHRVRDRGDPLRHRGRRVEPRARARHARADRDRGRDPARDRRHVVPADDLRLPERRRLLRREPREPRRDTRRSSPARRCSSTTSSPSRCRSRPASPRSSRSPQFQGLAKHRVALGARRSSC